MDLFYFHTKSTGKAEHKTLALEWLWNGCFLVLSASTKQKNKTHQCNGNFSSFRIYSFLSFLSSSSLSYFAMSLRFLLGVGGGSCEGEFFPSTAKQWNQENAFLFVILFAVKRRKCIYNSSPSKWQR
jgi:hypothetical protein